MNREIEFRGQKTSTKEWIEGSLIINKAGDHVITQVIENPVSYGTLNGWCFAVIPETIGQYTGLNDRNGKKVFSKDYVKQGDSLFRVEMCVGGFECIEIKLLKNGGFIEGSTYSFSILSDKYIESLGYNPELINQ